MTKGGVYLPVVLDTAMAVKPTKEADNGVAGFVVNVIQKLSNKFEDLVGLPAYGVDRVRRER